MQIGIDSFAAAISDAATGLPLSPVERMHHLLEEIELADQLGHASDEASPATESFDHGDLIVLVHHG